MTVPCILARRGAAMVAATTLAAAVLVAPARAQTADPQMLFRWTLATTTATVAPGETLWVAATLEIAPGHHVYAERTRVTVAPPTGVTVGALVAPAPRRAFDRFEEREMATYVGRASFRLPLVVAQSFAGEQAEVNVTLATQGCSETMCFFPMTEERTVTLAVARGPTGPGRGFVLLDPAHAGSSTFGLTHAGSSRFDLGRVLARQGLLLALALMFVGGVLTSFTPCVYPLIPITVSFFGASRAAPLRGFALSVVFVLGMATMYSALGVSAAATGAVFGSVMSNPAVIGVVAIVFLTFAASMFGAFKIRLSPSLQARLASVGGVGYPGAFLAGLVAGIIAAPCTGPVLGAALAYVATTADLAFGFAAMFIFALGMGLLFIVIGTFSARIVPPSGPWLERTESVFGIIMATAALYILKGVIPPLAALVRPGSTAALVSAALVVVGLVLGAVHLRFVPGLDAEGNVQPSPAWHERLRKSVGVAMVVAGLFGMIGTASTLSRAVVPSDAGESFPRPAWVYDVDAALARARAEGKPVLIDGYADWCVVCKDLDRETYSHPAVRARLERFIAVKLDLTASTPATQEIARRYHIVGLPTAIIIDSRGQELRDLRILGYVSPKDLLDRLEGVD